MNQFVTGGTGYPGSAATAALLADGPTVHPNVRSIAPAGRLPAEPGPIAGDATGPRARTDQFDGVVHAAAPNDATSGSFDAAFLDVALCALGVRTAPAGSCYLGIGGCSPAMAALATAASRSRGLNGRMAAEPEAGSRARLGLFLATFMLLPDTTAVNTTLPSTHGEES
jgi:hypothetical protein